MAQPPCHEEEAEFAHLLSLQNTIYEDLVGQDGQEETEAAGDDEEDENDDDNDVEAEDELMLANFFF